VKTRITKWGNSLAIRIPKLFAAQLEIDVDREVDVQLENSRIVISRPRKQSLKQLLNKITPNNIHCETEMDSPKGKEVW